MSLPFAVLFAWFCGSLGIVLGGMLGANRRSELEDEIADLRRRLLSRYEEHA